MMIGRYIYDMKRTTVPVIPYVTTFVLIGHYFIVLPH